MTNCYVFRPKWAIIRCDNIKYFEEVTYNGVPNKVRSRSLYCITNFALISSVYFNYGTWLWLSLDRNRLWLVINLWSLPVTWCTNSLTFNNCTFFAHCSYVFCIYLRTNSDLCHLQHKLIGLYNRDEKCLLHGTNWVFK